MNDKRRFKRRRITINVEYDISRNQKWLDSTSTNISSGGMCLVTHNAMRMDSSIQLKFLVPDTTKPVFVTGKVVWTEKFLKENNTENYYNGIEFTKMENSDRDIINKYVESTTFDSD